MALVAYEMSDGSDVETENEETAGPAVPDDPPVPGDPATNSKALFNVLPKPKTSPMLLDSELSTRLLLNKKTEIPKKKTVKIAVPALKDFEDEDLPRPMTKKITASTTKVGLFSILPPPKNTGMAATLKLMPDRLKKTTPFQKPTLQAPKLPPKQLQPLVSALLIAEEDDSDEEQSTDFFSLSKPLEEPILPSVGPVAEPKPEIVIPVEPEPNPTPEIEMIQGPDLELDDSALQQLCGGSKRKRTNVQAEIIDVSQRDLVPDRNEWMIKAITDEKLTRIPKQEVKNSLGKRKHQITYLADQARVNQVELEEQWAHNRMMKKQTRQKYGF